MSSTEKALNAVLDLPGLDDVRQLAASAGHEDVRGVAGVQGGLELAVHVLVLDGLDLDGHTGVGLLELADHVLPVGLAVTGGGVVPERHRDVATVIAGAAVRAATTGGQGEQPGQESGRGGQGLACSHQIVLFIECDRCGCGPDPLVDPLRGSLLQRGFGRVNRCR